MRQGLYQLGVYEASGPTLAVTLALEAAGSQLMSD